MCLAKCPLRRSVFILHEIVTCSSILNSEMFFKSGSTEYYIQIVITSSISTTVDHRTVYREDLRLLKKIQAQKEGEETATGGGRGIRTSTASHGRKGEVPEDSLSLQFVHG